MPLTLRIENFTTLPDGGPMSFVMRGQARADIGRDTFLDWSLPDPQRFVSGKHCEIQRQGQNYVLVDVSTNGTFVNGSSTRVQSPYSLKDGDQLQIGEYLIRVIISGDEETGDAVREPASGPKIERPASYDSLWEVDGDVAPPANAKDFWPRNKPSPIYGEFLYRAADLPSVADDAQFAPAAEDGLDWASSSPRPQPPPSPRRKPEPRRAAVAPTFEGPSPSDQSAHPVIEAHIPTAMPVRRASPAAAAELFLDAFARAAGVPSESLSHRSPEELGALLGSLLLAITGEMQQLLQARVQAKRLARSGEHTVIQPEDNNPLKFCPTPEDALRIMLGPPTRSYLEAQKAMASGFADLKRHQIQTYSAMQKAVEELMSSFDPAQIERAVPSQPAMASLVKSRKAQLWDAYVATWETQTNHQTEGLIQKFMLHFGRFYDRAGEGP